MRKHRPIPFWEKYLPVALFVLAGLICVSAFVVWQDQQPVVQQTEVATTETSQAGKQVATIVASGDMLYHDLVYGSAFNGTTYDFSNDYAQIKPLVSKADLALGDFEGTISPEKPLSGYPLFNAPIEVVDSIKDAGYDAIDLAHNHILDTHLSGLKSTVKAFEDKGVPTFGVKASADAPDILYKDINGIRVAIVGYAYGFNGLESQLTQQEYATHLKDLTPEKVQADLQKAEQEADITVVMPQLGEEYRLEPTAEQVKLYKQMVEWGADIIFGGHPHVLEPTEIVEKDGEKKFIIYSMGNLLSNQRYETLQNYWTERGVIMEVEITKENGKTVLSGVKPHPTWVSRTPIDRRYKEHQAYDYQVFLTEDYIAGGQYENTVDEATKQRIQKAHTEILELLDVQWN